MVCRFLVRVLSHTPAKPVPLVQVSESIRTKLSRDKFLQKRKAYLDQLKSRSKIKVNEADWQAVQKELGDVK